MISLTVGAVLFDMDGVLVDSRGAIDRVRRRWARKVGLDEEIVVALPHGQKTRDIVAHLTPHLDLEAEVKWLDDDEDRDLDGITEIRGAGALLSALKPDEWAVVTSSGGALARARLTAAGLPIPGTIVSGDMVRTGKPSPEGYQMGAAKLGRRASDCVVIEDAPAGIAAGLAAGARVIGVATTSARVRLATLGCAAIVDDLAGIQVDRSGGGLTLVLHS